MKPWPAHRARESVLRELEGAMVRTPEALDTRFYYASFLRDHGELDQAAATFAEILDVAGEHVETLIAYGAVLARQGRRLEARAAFERAVAARRDHPGALVNLANMLALDEPERARALYASALERDPACVPAHRGLCSLHAAVGDAAAAARHRAAGYAGGPFGRRPYTGAVMPPCVIALVSTDGGNVPLGALLDERTFLVHELFVEAYRGEPLPPHDLIVNAIGDADRSAPALRSAGEIAAAARRPVMNDPAAVLATGRVANAERLGHVPGVVAPSARRLARDASYAGPYPVIVRAPGLHMGRGMVRVDAADALAAALAALPGRGDAIAIDYVETRSADGAWRKYRVMAIGGRLYALHLAIAHRWDVHYFSSAMAEREDYRAEEARFLASPAATLGPAAWSALQRVAGVLGLDYAGIDVGLAADGRPVVFEANAAMTVIPPDRDVRFGYRRAASEAVSEALRDLFRSRGAPAG